MSEIEDITGTEFHKLLEPVQLGESNVHVVNSHINEWQDRWEELLGVISTPADDTLKGRWRWHPVMGGVRNCVHERTRVMGSLCFHNWRQAVWG